MALPDGRFLIAFGEGTLDWDATFTRIDSYDSLVTSYTIDRGRQIETDRTDTGRATVEIADRDGILDPTNPDGPYYTQIGPLLQAALQHQNPVDGLWYTRFRGWIEELDYQFDPSQQVNRLTVSLVDIFEIVAAVELLPGDIFGNPPPSNSAGQVYYPAQSVQDRIVQLLGDAGIPEDFQVIFTGATDVWQTVYSPGESVLDACQEAADGDWPGLANLYTDRLGRLVFHGRLAKLDPEGTEASAEPGTWDFIRWKAGDHAAVNADPVGTAHLRRFAFNRGLSHIINTAFATPTRAHTATPLTAAEIEGQQVEDTSSIALYGRRSWSAQELLTKQGFPGPTTDLVETKKYADYYVSNYGAPVNRATECGFRTMRPDAQGATKTWELMSKIDIGDAIQITVGSPGGGGFDAEECFVEGIHETCEPLNPDMDDITVSLDLSPAPTNNPYD